MSAWVSGAVVASAVIGGNAASSAAKTQANATKDAAGLQYQAFKDQQAAQEPFRQGGMAAQNRLMTLLGIGGQDMRAKDPIFGVPGGIQPVDSKGNPTGLQVDSSSADYGKYARDFGMSDFRADPGYQFRLSEGLKALDRQAAARGGLISGAALKAAQGYGQEQASQEYTNAFNRYQTNRANQLNPLQSLMGAGQSAVNQVGQAGQTYANNAGELGMQGSAARASGYLGTANSINQGIGSYLNYKNNQGIVNALGSSNAGGSSGYDPNFSANYGFTGSIGNVGGQP
jgi:hypothetical protein